MEAITHVTYETYDGGKFSKRTLEIATASIEDLNKAYIWLNERCYAEGAYPGTQKWFAAKKIDDQRLALKEARPDLMAYRAAAAEAARAAKLAGINPYTL